MIHREKPSISITLPKHVHDWIAREAAQSHRSRSQMIAAIIEEGIKRREDIADETYLTVVNERQSGYTTKRKRSPSYAPSPLELIIQLARKGVRSLQIDPAKPVQTNLDHLHSKFPDLLQALTRLARQTEAEPAAIQPFDERLWPYTQKELYALRDVYSLIWRRQHS
jgi:hypothetical protein